MWSDKTLYGLIAVVYGCLVLTHLWPYLSQAWTAYREGRPVRDVPRPEKNKLIAGSLAFLTGVLWIWQYFRH